MGVCKHTLSVYVVCVNKSVVYVHTNYKVDHPFTFSCQNGNDQIRLRRQLQLKNSILSHFLGCPGGIEFGKYFMFSLRV